MAKERIEFDPAKWDQKTIQHIKDHNPPDTLWSTALPKLIDRKLKVDSFTFWWTDLSIYDPATLDGWKLTGRGSRVNGVLRKGEKVYKNTGKVYNSIRIGAEDEEEFNLPEPQTYDPEKFADVRSDKMVGCETDDGLLNIHSEDALCEVCGEIDHDHACPLCGYAPIYRESTRGGESVAPHKYYCHSCNRGFDTPAGKDTEKFTLPGLA